MGLRVNNNIAAVNAYRNLSVTDGMMAKSLEKLSSGYRINRAGDDAAGLVISEKLRGQISGLKQAGRNAQDGISVIQTAEGALTETQSLLQRVRELAVQASNSGVNDRAARDAIAAEVDQSLKEVDRIATSTKFGGQQLLAGTGTPSTTKNFSFQVGAEAGADNQVSVNVGAMDAASLTLEGVSTDLKSSSNGAAFAGGTVTAANNTLTFAVSGGPAQSITLDVGKVYAAGAAGATAFQADVQAKLDNANIAVKATATGAAVRFEDVVGGAGTALAVTGTATAITGAQTAGATNAAGVFTAAAVATGNKNVAEQIRFGQTAALATVDAAITTVSKQRGELGAYQNRLEHTIANLSVTAENLAASESRIRDTDMALEMTQFTKSQILTQAGTAMLAQANSSPQQVLQLLKG